LERSGYNISHYITQMAQQFIYTCSECGYSISAWGDGNPYFISDEGKRLFFYHPSESLLKEYIAKSEGRDLTGDALNEFLRNRTGNMSDMICLDSASFCGFGHDSGISIEFFHS